MSEKRDSKCQFTIHKEKEMLSGAVSFNLLGSQGQYRRQTRLMALLLFLISLGIGSVGIEFGLPSEVRSQHYPSQTSDYYDLPQSNRLYTTAPYESYHPDEGAILNALSNMSPSAFDFNPDYFNYPTLHIYSVGLLIFALDSLQVVELEGSKQFYAENPASMAEIYVAGRWLSVLMAAATCVLLFLAITELFDSRVGVLSGLLLLSNPLWVRNSHFMLVNVPAAFYMTLAAALSIYSISRQKRSLVIVGFVVAGLAASTKYPAGAIVLVVLFAGGKTTDTQGSRVRLLALGVLGFIISFLLGTPYALLTPDQFLQDILFEGGSKTGMVPLRMALEHLVYASGTPMALILIGGLTLVAIRVSLDRDWRYVLLLLWLLAGAAQRLISDANFVRYLVTAIPPLMAVAAFAVMQIWDRQQTRQLRWASLTIALVASAFTLAYSTNILRAMFGADVRNEAAEYIAAQPTGSKMGIFGDLYFDMPPIHAELYDIVDLGQSPATLVPDYVIFSSHSADAAREYLKQTRIKSLTARSFEQSLAGIWTFPFSNSPDDWAYTFLDISVVQLDSR